jgi:parvulin-like peptidyl-prolyl isomerase
VKKFVGTLIILVASISYASEVLAVVNGKNITSEVAPKNFKTLEKRAQEKIIKKLIEKRLASDYALASGVSESDEYKKVLKHILNMSENKKQKTKDTSLVETFHQKSIKGYTKEQLRSKKGLLAFDFLLTQKAKSMQPSNVELKKFYQNQKYMYDTPAQIELLNIVVEKESLAKEIIARLSKSSNKLQEFSSLAKKYSLAPSKTHYGYFGKIAIKNLNEVLKKNLADKKRGYFTNTPIKTEFGYEIFYVLNDIPKFDSTFEALKERVKEEFIQKTVKSWAINKIKSLKENAKIKILL